MHYFARLSRRAARVAAPLLLAAAGPALAATQSSASITGLVITLTDLDLTDGIAPSIRFDNSRGGPEFYVKVGSAFGDHWSQLYEAPRPFTPSGLAFESQMGQASAEFSAPTGGPAGASLSVSGQALGAYNGNYTSFDIWALGPATYWGDFFTLSANTKVSFSAYLDASSSTSVGIDAAGNTEGGQASATMWTGGYNRDGVRRSQLVEVGVYTPVDPVCDPLSGFCGSSVQESGFFTVSYANFSRRSVEGDFLMHLSAWGYSEMDGSLSARAVPELPVPALMAFGLGLVGISIRRRARGRF